MNANFCMSSLYRTSKLWHEPTQSLLYSLKVLAEFFPPLYGSFTFLHGLPYISQHSCPSSTWNCLPWITDWLISLRPDPSDGLKESYDFCRLSVFYMLSKTQKSCILYTLLLIFTKALNLFYYYHLHIIYKETEL